jgi:hypothetical protein
MFVTFAAGFALATAVIVTQRLCWRSAPGARERKAGLRLAELSTWTALARPVA